MIRHRPGQMSLALTLSCLAALPARAIVIRHDRDPQRSLQLAERYPCVGAQPPHGLTRISIAG